MIPDMRTNRVPLPIRTSVFAEVVDQQQILRIYMSSPLYISQGPHLNLEDMFLFGALH